jgi:organic hydroperoxide reductase OsmC/OhrA
MAREHHYRARLVWTGADAGPARDYRSYSRACRVVIDGKPDLLGSADPAFRGDSARHNPEDWLLAALSACHMLSYLALATRGGIAIAAYEDEASGVMAYEGGTYRFREVVLRPRVVVESGDLDLALRLHDQAGEECFIAASVAFPVLHEAVVVAAGGGGAREPGQTGSP